MDQGAIIGVTAVAISLVTLIAMAIGMRDKARTTTVDMLTQQLVILRGELSAMGARAEACERDRVKLTEENERLMRRVLKLDNGAPR